MSKSASQPSAKWKTGIRHVLSLRHITPSRISDHHCFCVFVYKACLSKTCKCVIWGFFWMDQLLECLLMACEPFLLSGTCEVPLFCGRQVSIETSLSTNTPWVIARCWDHRRSGKFELSVCENTTSHSPHRSITWLTLWLLMHRKLFLDTVLRHWIDTGFRSSFLKAKRACHCMFYPFLFW